MSNQWGRTNQVTRSGGSSGLVLAAVLCLALIGAGAYFWFARQAMQTEIAALKAKTSSLVQELGKAKAEGDKAAKDLAEFRKNSGNWAGELEQEYAELKLNEVPKLTRLLDKRDADIVMLEKRLLTEKASAKSAADDFTATISTINAQLAAAKEQVGNAKEQAQAIGTDNQALKAQIASLRSALERAMADAVAARKALEQKQVAAETTQPALKSALELARDAQIRTLEQSLGAERKKVAALEKQLADQTAAVAGSSQEQPDEVSAGDAPARRDSALVDDVVTATRGLGFLNDEKTARLKDQLVAGACVTDALESVFDRVPLVLMRNLMRDLKSDC